MQDELISRQAAIDAVNDIIADYVPNLFGRYEALPLEMASAINRLPSVNPQPKIGWTPVSQGMPEENKTVIASTKFGVYPEARYTKEDGWEWAYESGADYWEELKVTVTAWMPLPQPYEPQERSDEE